MRRGDVVYLRLPGAPAMLVTGTDGGRPNEAHCVWFDASGNLQGHLLEVDLLTTEPPPHEYPRPSNER